LRPTATTIGESDYGAGTFQQGLRDEDTKTHMWPSIRPSTLDTRGYVRLADPV
jgi:hypothetical protein